MPMNYCHTCGHQLREGCGYGYCSICKTYVGLRQSVAASNDNKAVNDKLDEILNDIDDIKQLIIGMTR